MNTAVPALLSLMIHALPTHADSFSASAFFEMIAPTMSRPVTWPAKVHFRPEPISVSELSDLVRGTWNIASSCSGRPVEHAKVVAWNIERGSRLSRAVIRFTGETAFELQQITDDPGPVYKTRLKIPYTLTIKSVADGILYFHSKGYTTAELQANQIVETGELVLLDRSDELNKHNEGICAPGERFEYVYVLDPGS